jgi:hypothetical protein
MMYSILPAVELLGLDKVWLIVDPDPALAPVMAPVLVPMVHVNVLAALAVNAMFGLVALHIDKAAGFVTAGFGLTVTVMV